MLLAAIDGAAEREIHRAMRVDKDDATLLSRRMEQALPRVKSSHLSGPASSGYLDASGPTPQGDSTSGIVTGDFPGVAWSRRYGASLEVEHGRLLWSDVAVARMIAMATALFAQMTHGSLKLLDDARQTNQTLAVNNNSQANEHPQGHGDSFGSVAMELPPEETQDAFEVVG